jgi:hypothetical protein
MAGDASAYKGRDLHMQAKDLTVDASGHAPLQGIAAKARKPAKAQAREPGAAFSRQQGSNIPSEIDGAAV